MHLCMCIYIYVCVCVFTYMSHIIIYPMIWPTRNPNGGYLKCLALPHAGGKPCGLWGPEGAAAKGVGHWADSTVPRCRCCTNSIRFVVLWYSSYVTYLWYTYKIIQIIWYKYINSWYMLFQASWTKYEPPDPASKQYTYIEFVNPLHLFDARHTSHSNAGTWWIIPRVVSRLYPQYKWDK